jgi:hypothetical protein
VLQPLAPHWIQIYCTVLYSLPYCLVVSYMPPPQHDHFNTVGNHLGTTLERTTFRIVFDIKRKFTEIS